MQHFDYKFNGEVFKDGMEVAVISWILEMSSFVVDLTRANAIGFYRPRAPDDHGMNLKSCIWTRFSGYATLRLG